jgi:nicotinate-nucleotide pyrophosphorylase (carboxylating)
MTTSITFPNLLPPSLTLQSLVLSWLSQDSPSLEIGGFVVGNELREAKLLGKSPGVVAGIPFAQAVFDVVGGLSVQWLVQDGYEISIGDAKEKKPIAIVRGPAKSILLAERTALNILSRASGVATTARKFTSIAKSGNWKGMIAATRKTTPGFSLVEKYAALVGGVATHRLDLSQMVMLKDNHVWSVGNIGNAIAKAKLATGFSCKIEVEARTLEEAIEAASNGADIVMLDNMPPKILFTEASTLKQRFPHIIIEASGGINEFTLKDYLSPHVDVISIGKITQGYECLDFSLKITKQSSAL